MGETLKRELMARFEQLPHQPAYDEYCLVRMESKAQARYEFSASEAFDVLRKNGNQSEYIIDRALLQGAAQELASLAYAAAVSPTDVLYTLGNSAPKAGETAQNEIHHIVIYDWLGALEEYDICIRKGQASVLPFALLWEGAQFVFNARTQLIWRFYTDGFEITTADKRQLEPLKKAISARLEHYQTLWGVSPRFKKF